VRAKAGGSQSSHDGQGKNAKSVGAMLRRYGEQALTEDVRAILKDWSAHIQSCSSVFISCPKTMRSVIFEEGLKDKDTPLKRTDPRIRLVPFMVTVSLHIEP
jgi:Bacteroidetes VLRF1 release factor